MVGGVREDFLGVDADAVSDNNHIALFFGALPEVVYGHRYRHPDAMGEIWAAFESHIGFSSPKHCAV